MTQIAKERVVVILLALSLLFISVRVMMVIGWIMEKIGK